MVFSSWLFLFYFLPASLIFYYAAPRRARHFVLTIASYVFYGWANPLFVVLLFGSTLIDYVCGLVIDRARRDEMAGLKSRPTGETAGLKSGPTYARAALVVSICSNLSLLFFFKYFNFGVDSYDAVVDALGLQALRLDVALRVTLPLGISFYTFQSMSYTIDIYRDRTRALVNPIDFACYVSMFPQLVAGPIIRFNEVADQLRQRTHTIEKFARGVAFLSLGLAKKVLIANPCGRVADLAFGAGSLHALDAWYGVIAYAFQIYFDFSGYSDMAVGLGLMFGFVFAKNFDSPYRSRSITEFWRRWHISLSTWLRDYLYVPLGGNRKGPARTYVNLFIVMLLGGLWHGAAWNFVVWGGLHGALLAYERMRGKAAAYAGLRGPAATAVTFFIVLITWVFFRAADLASAFRYLGHMAGVGAVDDGAGLIGGVIYQPYYVGTVALAALVTWRAPQTWDWSRRLTAPRVAIATAAFALAALALTTQAYNPFIYFIF
jgi:alginate O-acetyltransferase complex protein AlgI